MYFVREFIYKNYIDKAVALWSLLIIIVLGILLHFWEKQKKFPPGPWGIPLFGYWPFLKEKIHVSLCDLGEKYGDVFSFRVGRRLVVVLNSYDAIRQAYLCEGKKFDGRVEAELDKKGEAPGIFYAEGQTWTDYKRFGISILRDLHMSKTSLEPVITDEIHHFMKAIQSVEGKPTNFKQFLSMGIHNITNVLIWGKRSKYIDEEYQVFLKHSEEFLTFFQALTQPCYSWFQIHWLRNLIGFPEVFDGKESFSFYQELRDILEKNKTKNDFERETDFPALWSLKREQMGIQGNNLTELHLAKFLSSIYAGTEAAADAFIWYMLWLAEYPEVQRRIQNEIDDVIGQGQSPSYGDKGRMPYTEATLHELDRVITAAPVILPHCNRERVEFLTYEIPKRSAIMANLWSVNHNPKVYPEPYKFKPERFLNAQGNVDKPTHLIPFSLGRRLCPGEILARMNLFLFMTSILQNYTIRKVEGKAINFDFKANLFKIPEPQELILEARNRK